MKYIGKGFEYLTHNGTKRVAKVESIEFHPTLKKPIFIGKSPFGNTVKLTREEIHRFL